MSAEEMRTPKLVVAAQRGNILPVMMMMKSVDHHPKANERRRKAGDPSQDEDGDHILNHHLHPLLHHPRHRWRSRRNVANQSILERKQQLQTVKSKML